MLALTLPQDVLDVLQSVHSDPGWAIVQLVERFLGRERRRRWKPRADVAELVHLPGSRSLIVVQSQVFARMPGVITIPLEDGRAFLAFRHPAGLADLEVAILDKMDAAPAKGPRRGQLMRGRDIVRKWRHDRGLEFRTMGILVGQGGNGGQRHLLPSLKSGARSRAPDSSRRPTER